jgi:hypothetical protein
MHNLNSIPNPAVKRVCTESKKTPLQSTTAFTVSNCLASLVLCPAALCVCDVVCVRVCCEQRKTVCMMFDQTPPMVFRYDVMDITTSACFRGVVYCCDSGEGFRKFDFLRQDGGNKTGLIKSFGRCRRSVGGSVKGFLSVCSSELEHRE